MFYRTLFLYDPTSKTANTFEICLKGYFCSDMTVTDNNDAGYITYRAFHKDEVKSIETLAKKLDFDIDGGLIFLNFNLTKISFCSN